MALHIIPPPPFSFAQSSPHSAWLHQHQHQHKHKHVDEASDVSGDSRQLRKLPAQPERYSPDGTVPSHGSGEKSSRHHHHHHADMVSPGLSRGQGHGSLSDEESAATSASPWLSSQQRHSHPPCARKTSPLKSPSRTERTLSPLRSHQHKLEPSSAMGNPHGHEGRAAASGGGDGGEGRGERKATYGDNGERAYHPSRDEGSHASGMKRLLTGEQNPRTLVCVDCAVARLSLGFLGPLAPFCNRKLRLAWFR